MRQKHLFFALAKPADLQLFFRKPSKAHGDSGSVARLEYSFKMFFNEAISIKVIMKPQDLPATPLPLGILWVVPKKIKNATDRNLVRRRLRHIWRQLLAAELEDPANQWLKTAAAYQIHMAVFFQAKTRISFEELQRQNLLLWKNIASYLAKKWPPSESKALQK